MFTIFYKQETELGACIVTCIQPLVKKYVIFENIISIIIMKQVHA